ncbi:hypothetical protein [Oceanobacillus bengalensis]|uniref:Uncharacterized protein n=1 Tax=Oceanobacillus bengalensis TaxID=1435466 RepID=A0A494Z7U2_9BACI|nr:hypothetical protein [Oceanobacillus bengalensis]RKQ18681.1 hypothetical protein D8M05_00790 [Oceanobacillus bengalensis]
MKQIAIGWIILLLVLVACSSEDEMEAEGDAAIQVADLSNYERNLTNLIGDQVFVFDLDVTNKDVEELHTIVDYYEDGELVDTLGGMSMSINEEDREDTIRTVFLYQKPNTGEETWITSIMTQNGQASQNTPHDISGREEISSTASAEIAMPAPLFIGETKVIATVINSNKSGVSTYNEINTEEDLEKATDYEQVYIISIELS